ncbi:MAG: hypothetical protein IKG27_02340 [Bacilli bacterium]|nr:hypothetical protein [Bacilli bacterium]
MKLLKRLIYVLIFLLICYCISFSFLNKANLKPVNAQLNDLDLSGFNKLMIVAHPEDETVWGGVHLLSDNYLVVCVSCGFDSKKEKKMEKVLEITKDRLVKLGYSDKFLVRRHYRGVKKRIKKILNYKTWELVVTHNPDGETGNLEHKQISEIVSNLDIYNLYYFGNYYNKKELIKLDKVTTLKGDLIKDKINVLIKTYHDKNLNNYKHMFPFEDWISRENYKV